MKMRILNLTAYLFIISISLMTVACSSDDDDNNNINIPQADPFEDYELLGSDKQGENTLQVYGKRKAFAGYNELFLVIRNNDDQPVGNMSQYTFTLYPEMDMGNMKHSAPHYNFESFNDDGAYEAAVVFVMPSTGGDWYLDITAENAGESHEYRVAVNDVTQPEEDRVKSFIAGSDSSRYFISLVKPLNPEVGKNDYIVTLHERKSAEDWPAVTDAEMTQEPWMPSMNHGSPDNKNPKHTEEGFYKGLVNFTMTGYWQVEMEISRNGDVLTDELYFDITF